MNKVISFKKNIILHVFIMLLIAGCGGLEETSQENRFADLLEYHLEQTNQTWYHLSPDGEPLGC